MSEPITKYHENGNVFSKEYFNDYGLHNVNGPAYEEYYCSGELAKAFYLIDNEMHRTDGPAFILYRENGSVFHLRWFHTDKDLTSVVEKWLEDNNMDNNIDYKKMTENDFNRMWVEIL